MSTSLPQVDRDINIPPPATYSPLTHPSPPPATSPRLALLRASPAELEASHLANSLAWRGPLSPAGYLERERRLSSVELTRGGLLTGWVLVDLDDGYGSNGGGSGTKPGTEANAGTKHTRPILASVETVAKRAWVARGGAIEDVTAVAVGSVFCPPVYRGRGYASRMMAELGAILDGERAAAAAETNGERAKKGEKKGGEAGADQADGQHGQQKEQQAQEQQHQLRLPALFSVLFSDIGKYFYANHGWKPFKSTHFVLPSLTEQQAVAGSSESSIQIHDLDAAEVVDTVCSPARLAQLRAQLAARSAAIGGDDSDGSANQSNGPAAVLVSFQPDYAHTEWFWTREEFLAQQLGFVGPGGDGESPCSAAATEKEGEKNEKEDHGKRVNGLSPTARAQTPIQPVRVPTIKGAAALAHDLAVVWYHDFTAANPADRALYVLYVQHPPTCPLSQSAKPGQEAAPAAAAAALSALLRRAQIEAARWGLAAGVCIWDPSPLTTAAVQLRHQQQQHNSGEFGNGGSGGSGALELVEREWESVCALRWCGQRGDRKKEGKGEEGEIVWEAREKFCWF